jgi:hypothetical protein
MTTDHRSRTDHAPHCGAYRRRSGDHATDHTDHAPNRPRPPLSLEERGRGGGPGWNALADGGQTMRARDRGRFPGLHSWLVVPPGCGLTGRSQDGRGGRSRVETAASAQASGISQNASTGEDP